MVQNGLIDFSIFMNRHISESGHRAQPFSKRFGNQPRVLNQSESIGAAFGHTEPLRGNQVHGKVDGGLAGTLDVQGARIGVGKVGQGWVAGVFCLNPADTAFDDRRLAQGNIVRRYRHLPPLYAAGAIENTEKGPWRQIGL